MIFGRNFNQNINLPSKLTYLELHNNVNWILENLPNGIEILELGYAFDLEMNNLSSGIKKNIFDQNSPYDKFLNCLPKSVKYLLLPQNYTKSICKLPKNLNIIKCYRKYKFINNLYGQNLVVELY